MVAAAAYLVMGATSVWERWGAISLFQLLLCGWLFHFVTVCQLEHLQRRRLLNVEEAAQPMSSFREVAGLKLHIVEERVAKPEMKLLLAHGVGANAFTWEAVLQPLRDGLSATCMAHDRVGFGLTERPTELSKYCNPFNVQIVEQLASVEQDERVVLVGHSLGGLTMALAALNTPHVEALVLVAPAILADGSIGGIWGKVLSGCTRFFIAAMETLVLACSPVILYLLRLLVYNNGFWKMGVGKSWCVGRNVPQRLLVQYQWPSLVRDWDMGMVCFLRTQLRFFSVAAAMHAPWHVDPPAHDGQTLVQRINACELPILIVHGSADRIVPIDNSRRLQQQLTRCKLVEIPECGHTPHEEWPVQFVQAVSAFLLGAEGKE